MGKLSKKALDAASAVLHDRVAEAYEPSWQTTIGQMHAAILQAKPAPASPTRAASPDAAEDVHLEAERLRAILADVRAALGAPGRSDGDRVANALVFLEWVP